MRRNRPQISLSATLDKIRSVSSAALSVQGNLASMCICVCVLLRSTTLARVCVQYVSASAVGIEETQSASGDHNPRERG